MNVIEVKPCENCKKLISFRRVGSYGTLRHFLGSREFWTCKDCTLVIEEVFLYEQALAQMEAE
jgi:hypothetical protein